MNLYHIVLLFLVCAVNCIVGMEVTPELSWYDLTDTFITQVAARSEQSDKRSLCLVNKQLSIIASEKNIDNLLMHPCKLSKNYLRDCMIRYAVAKNRDMFIYALYSAPLCNFVDAETIFDYFALKNDLNDLNLSYKQAKNNEDFKSYYNFFIPRMMEVYRGEPAAYCLYKNKYSGEDKYFVLQVAAYFNHLSVAELLLAQEKQGIVDVRTKKADMFDFPPLHFAVFAGHLDMTKLLCEHPKTDINAVDNYGCTALMYAVGPNKTEKTVKIAIVKLLLQHEANLSITNLAGQSVYNFVSCSEILQLLTAAKLRMVYDELGNKWEELKGSIADWF